jgi:hypothetical protein
MEGNENEIPQRGILGQRQREEIVANWSSEAE